MQQVSESRIVEIVKEFRFEAAHFLPRVPAEHKCRRMHGHSFRFEIKLVGPVAQDSGWLMDFGDISRVVRPVVDSELDHRLLNEVEGLDNPTSEEIAIWLWRRLKPSMPLLKEITVHETCNSRCVYRG